MTIGDLSGGERYRLLDRRYDWRDKDWQDHCGIPGCEQCSGWADSYNNTLKEASDPEGWALMIALKDNP